MNKVEITYVPVKSNDTITHTTLKKNQFLALGLNPGKLKEAVLEEILNVAKYSVSIISEKSPRLPLLKYVLKKSKQPFWSNRNNRKFLTNAK